MNVQQLINKLQELPPKTKVVIAGFEGGFQEFDDTTFPFNITKSNISRSWLIGPYSETDENSADESAILLGARRR